MSEIKPAIKQVVVSTPEVKRPDMVVDSESSLHGFEQATKQCVWHLGSVCFGDKFTASLFSGQLKVPICQHHMDGHRVIMTIASKMTDKQRKKALEAVLEMTEEDRLSLVRSRGYKLVPWSEV